MFGKKNQEPLELTISNRTILRVIALIVLTGVAIQLIVSLRHPLTLIFVAFFLAMALNPAVMWVSHKLKSKSRARATAIAYITVISVLIAFFVLLIPPLVRQTTDFVKEAPDTLREVQNDEGAVGEFIRRYKLEEQVKSLANSWADNIDTGPVVSTANRVIANVFSIVTVLILTFMMLIEGPKWMKFIWGNIPGERRAHTQDIVHRMYSVVTNYVNGQVLVAAIGATFATTALFITTTILGINTINPIALGGIVFLFNLVPYIGVFISSTLVVLFSLFASVPLAVTMLIFFIVYQQIENATIQPLIQSRGLELTPMLVFIAAIIGVSLGGILGALIAIPTVGCIRILVEDYLERNTSYIPKIPKSKKA